MNNIIKTGMMREESFLVEESHTASHLGSGNTRVLATPWMIAFMERTCHRLLAEQLPGGYSSVGILVNIRHLAPCMVGSVVMVKAEVIGVDGLKVLFKVSAHNKDILLGDGTHERFVINEKRFLEKIKSSS
ncbi:MAG: thioesterase family protein [Anaerolineales bacterium]